MLPFVSRDVATEPPTTVVIVATDSTPPNFLSCEDTIYAITEDCVEPTEGWLNREGKPLLTICFMHSFGKCCGRCNLNPRTCFQIHINRDVLNSLRRHYSNPTRRYFTRTIKAHLGPDLRQQLYNKAKKEVKVQYLKYRVHDAFPSAGLWQYEGAYRRWLFSTDHPSSSSITPVQQCHQFACTGACLNGSDCPFIHANPKSAQVRDPVLSKALQELCDAVYNSSATSLTLDTVAVPGSTQLAASSVLPLPGGYTTMKPVIREDSVQPAPWMIPVQLVGQTPDSRHLFEHPANFLGQ